jgi:hypothetical protein
MFGVDLRTNTDYFPTHNLADYNRDGLCLLRGTDCNFKYISEQYWSLKEDSSSTVVKVLCFNSEGRWYDPSWCHWILHWHKNPSDRTMALGSTQPLIEMSTRSTSWGGKGGRCVRLTALPPSCAVVTKSGNLNFLEPFGPLQACNGLHK